MSVLSSHESFGAARLEVHGAPATGLVRVPPIATRLSRVTGPSFRESWAGSTEAPASGYTKCSSSRLTTTEPCVAPRRTSVVVMSPSETAVEEHENTSGLRYSQVIINHGRQAGCVRRPHRTAAARDPVRAQGTCGGTAGLTGLQGGCLVWRGGRGLPSPTVPKADQERSWFTRGLRPPSRQSPTEHWHLSSRYRQRTASGAHRRDDGPGMTCWWGCTC